MKNLSKLFTADRLFFLLELLIVVFICYLVRSPADSNTKSAFYVFMERDISRAMELIKGHLILYGPELSGGGHLPGSFFYFLLGLPLLLGFKWPVLIYWMILLMWLGAIAGWYFLRKKFNSTVAFIWVLLYTIEGSFSYILKEFFNSSFSLVFLVFAQIFAFKAFTESEERSRKHSFWISCFAIGLAIQTHYAGLSYLVALLVLQLLSKKLKLQKLKTKSFLLGLFIFFLTVLPYILFVTLGKMGVSLGAEAPYTGSMLNSVPSLIFYFKGILNLGYGEFFISSLYKIFGVIFPILFFVLFFVQQMSKLTDSEVGPSADLCAQYLKIGMVFLSITIIPRFFYLFIPQGVRYGIPFVISICFFTSVLYYKISASDKKRFYLSLFAAVIPLVLTCYFYFEIENILSFLFKPDFLVIYVFVLLSGVLLFIKDKLSVSQFISYLAVAGLITFNAATLIISQKVIVRGSVPKAYNWQNIWDKIYADTGWSYEEAKNRIFFINHHIEQSPKMGYEFTIAHSVHSSKHINPLPDGYIVSSVLSNGYNADFKNWILQQSIPEVIKQAIRSGKLRVDDYYTQDHSLVAAYYNYGANGLPQHFHNIGAAYGGIPEKSLLDSIAGPGAAKKTGDDEYFFKWNECPDLNQYCNTGVSVKVVNVSANQYSFHAHIFGLPISQSSKWISPDWTQAWLNPYLEVKCDGKTHKLKMADSIGCNPKYVNMNSFNYPISNNSLLAPYDRVFQIRCHKPPTEISIGREGSIVQHALDSSTLPPQKLSLSL